MADPTPPRLQQLQELCIHHQAERGDLGPCTCDLCFLLAEARQYQDETDAAILKLADERDQLRAELAAARLALSTMQRDVDDALDGQFAGTEPCAARAVQQQREALDKAQDAQQEARTENERLRTALAAMEQKESTDQDLLLDLAEEKAATTKKPEGGHGTPQSS